MATSKNSTNTYTQEVLMTEEESNEQLSFQKIIDSIRAGSETAFRQCLN